MLLPNDEKTRAIAASGGKAKAKNARPTLARVEKELPPLDSPENCQRRLAVIANWMLAGLVPHGMGGPIVNSHREWLAAWNAQVDVERVKQLEQQLAALRDQLARAGGGQLRRAG